MSKSVGWQNEHCSREQETQFMLWVALSRPCHSLGLGPPWQRELLGWMISEDCGFILWYPKQQLLGEKNLFFLSYIPSACNNTRHTVGAQ